MTSPDKKCEELKPCFIKGHKIEVCRFCNAPKIILVEHIDREPTVQCFTCLASAPISTWNRPTRTAVAEGHKEICSSASPITEVPCHICGAKLPPPSGLVELDEQVMEAVIWQYFNPEAGVVRKIKDWADLSKHICSRFGSPARVVSVEIIDFLIEIRDRASYGKAVVPMLDDFIKKIKPALLCKTGEKGGE